MGIKVLAPRYPASPSRPAARHRASAARPRPARVVSSPRRAVALATAATDMPSPRLCPQAHAAVSTSSQGTASCCRRACSIRPARRRLHSAARARRQRLLRRPLPRPAVHGGEPLNLFALCEHAGRGRRVSTAPPFGRRVGQNSVCASSWEARRVIVYKAGIGSTTTRWHWWFCSWV